MGALQIISGILLIISSIVIILIVLVQESKQDGLSSAIGGTKNETFFGKNGANTHEAKLTRLTKIAAVIFFIVTLIVNIIAAHV